MQKVRWMVLAGMVAGVVLTGGCQPWRQKYEACNVDYENLQALFDQCQLADQQCQAEKDRLMQQLQSMDAKLRENQTRKRDPLEDEGGKYDPARGTITVSLTSDVLFDSGQITLKSSSKSTLSRIAGIIKSKHAGKEVWVIGHTDTDPIKKSKWKDNWQLSTERALSVTRYLLQQGVSAQQLVAAGRGQYKPAGSTKAQNRRVEIVVYVHGT